MLRLAINQREVTDSVLRDIQLLTILALVVLSDAVLEDFPVDEHQLLREEGQVTVNDGITS